MQNVRLKYLDIARGIGIFLVVLGHSIVTPLRSEQRVFQMFYDGIYFFHMAFFFYLSGYLVSLTNQIYKGKKQKAAFIYKKAKQLLIPYFFYSLLGYGVLGFLSDRDPVQCIFEIMTTENHMLHHLWFLYTMFAVSVIALFIPEGYSFHAMYVSAALHCVFSAIAGLPLICLYIVRYLFFFQAGRIWQSKKNLSFCTNLICFVVLEFLYIFVFAHPADFTGGFRIAERFLCSIIICAGGITGSQLIFKISIREEKSALGKKLEKLGKNSMEIYLLHMPLLVPGLAAVMWKLRINGIIILIVCTMAGIWIPLFAAKFIHKCGKLSFLMFGRKE